jgi:hypothetical protein
MHDDKPPTKKRERAAWDAAARLNALGIKATADGAVVSAAGFRMHAPERTGGVWTIALGWGNKSAAYTAEAALDDALAFIARGATVEVERLRDAIAAEEKKLATCASLRAKLAATSPERDPK